MDTLIGAGYSLSDLWAMTADQLELFARYASQRLAEESVSAATLAAIGAAVGFSGKDKPLKDLAKSLGVKMDSGRGGASGFEEFASHLAASGKVRKADTGEQRAERPKLPGPLRLPRGGGRG